LPNAIGKNRTDAALFAILFGGLGVHKFYMGSWGWGLVFIFVILLPVPGLMPVGRALIAHIISLAQGIGYLMMTDNDFAAKYPVETQSPFRW
jgi:TM2 domain-containing membrane protein YozV